MDIPASAKCDQIIDPLVLVFVACSILGPREENDKKHKKEESNLGDLLGDFA